VPNFQVLVPMLLTAPAFCIALLSPFAGRLSDRLGRRRLLLTAMFLYGCGGIAPFFLHEFSAVMASRVLLGVAEAFILTIGNALLADYFDETERRKWLAVQGAVGPAMATAVLYGSGALAGIGWQWPFVVYVLAFPIFGIAWLYLWEPEKREARPRAAVDMRAFPWRTAAVISIATLITSVIYFVFIVHFSLVLTAHGVREESRIGLITAVASIGVPLGAYVYKRYADRPVASLLFLVYLLMGIGYVGISLAGNETLIVVASWAQQIAAGMTIPILVAWALSSFPGEYRGVGMGFWSASFFAGQFLNPLAVGVLNGFTGSIVMTVAAFGVICLVIAGSVASAWRRRAA
jgi:MFS family permease